MTSDNVINLGEDTESYTAAIATVTAKAKYKAIVDARTYLSLHKNTLLYKMEQVFASNMQFMEDE